jgi:hypothetical protein
MRATLAAGALCALVLWAAALADAQSVPAPKPAPEPTVQSGVYGFSGARVPDSPRQGFVGECISIFDSGDKRQVAKAECFDNNPGSFRVALKPGRYMLHGPAGVKPIEIKRGSWTKIESIVMLPMGP